MYVVDTYVCGTVACVFYVCVWNGCVCVRMLYVCEREKESVKEKESENHGPYVIL